MLTTFIKKYTAPLASLVIGAYAVYKAPVHKMTSEGERPYNFSWVITDVLAGSAYPEYAEHYQYFHAQGISHVISLTDWKPMMDGAPEGMKNFFMPITEFEPPSQEQIREFVEYVDNARDKKQACVVHCHWGRGRTGTMLAAYLVKAQDKHPRDAIDEVRHRRPYSVETYKQEAAVFEYANYLKARGEENYDH